VSGQEFPQKNGSIWMLTLYTVPKGDINGDGYVDIADAVLALKILSGADATGIRPNYPASGADVNGDGKIGIQELEYILQRLGNLRP
jgi:Ca2+-binding EF-hand superfamily protein